MDKVKIARAIELARCLTQFHGYAHVVSINLNYNFHKTSILMNIVWILPSLLVQQNYALIVFNLDKTFSLVTVLKFSMRPHLGSWGRYKVG